ncbi:MAG: NAD(P)H-hydrate dehydratase [Pseudomonadota bacterium]
MSLKHGSFGEYSISDVGANRFSLPSSSEMAALDRETIAAGITGTDLMERAGSSIAQRVIAAYSNAKKVVVVCGPGNNGGDGLVIADTLAQAGLSVHRVIVAAVRYSKEFLGQLAKCKEITAGPSLAVAQDIFKASYYVFGEAAACEGQLGVVFSRIDSEELRELLNSSDLIVDALLGTGQREAPRGLIADLIHLINQARAQSKSTIVVAVDMPTGINGDTGLVHTPCVRADRTITVQCIKRGVLQFPARDVCGVIETVDAGISGETCVEYSLITRDNLPEFRPRPGDVHKGMLGRVLVIGGSLAMPGAPVLSALGALRTGAGIVSRTVCSGWSTISPLPEAMCEVLTGSAASFQAGDASIVAEMSSRYEITVIGPGLGVAAGTADFVAAVLEELRGRGARVVVDADALNIIAGRSRTLKGLEAIITPHPGEAARLLGCSTTEVQGDRFSAARELAQKMGAVVVLKGAGTLIHDGVAGYLVAEGTPYLATPGSGDVLAGVIAASVMRSRSLLDGALLGVWLHAKAGVAAAENRGGPILASEIADHVSSLVGVLESVSLGTETLI